MAYIFISHSKRDKKLVNNIRIIIENIGHKPIIMEMPDTIAIQKPIPYDEIRSNVQASDAVLVFITSEVVKTEYTKSWVNFEITTASAYSKPVFVFEHIEDIHQLANLPYLIPYITDYMIFDKESSEDLLKAQKHVKEIMPIQK